MKRRNPLQKKLQEIFSQKKFEELEPFKNTKSWKSLDDDDRSLLASLFVMQGEKQLEQGDLNAKESFELAKLAAPCNTEVFFRIGSAYSVDLNMDSLKMAEDAFNKILELDPHQFRALVSLGNVYNTLGMVSHEEEYFLKAQSCFNHASQLSHNENSEMLSHFYWHYGVCLYCLGKHSEESVDFFNAVQKFRLAAEFGLQDKFFWNTYGNALGELASLLGRHDLLTQVVELYRNAVKQAFDFFEGWFNLACVFQRLYDMHLTEEYFQQANECFKMASQINASNAFLWLKWAQLLATEGKLQHDIGFLKESFEKFAQADACDPNNALALGLWGEALLLCGSQAEDIEMLREAQQKILKSLEVKNDAPETWYIYGSSFYELGRYFNQEEYYHQAIEKFQFGLSIKQSEPLLWYGFAIACYAIGELREDLQWIEKSSQLFSRVLEFKGQGFRPFWNDWGVALMKMAELTHDTSYIESAIEKFENIIPRNPDQWDDGIDPEWLYNYGCALDFLGEFNHEIDSYELAVQALVKVLEMDPDYTNARYNLALSLAHLGELAKDVECFHKAIEQFQILLSQDGEDELGWSDYGLTIMHLALLIHEPGRPEQSQKLFEIAEGKFNQAISLGNNQAYYHLACLHALQGNLSIALHFLEKAETTGALPSLEQLLNDEWLENVREFPAFQQFIHDISSNP
jgi:tetratricopeptide (TPR) repeat protein